MSRAESTQALALDAAEKDYEQLLAMFRDLDRKAQGMSAVVSLLVAGTIAIFRGNSSRAELDLIDNVLLHAFAALCLVAIGSALASLYLRSVPRPSSPAYRAWIDLRVKEEITDDHLMRFSEDLISNYHVSSELLSTTVSSKGRWVRLAQAFLAASVLTIVIIMLRQVTVS